MVDFKHEVLIADPEPKTEDGVGRRVSNPDGYFAYSIFGSRVWEAEAEEGFWRKTHGIREGPFYSHDWKCGLEKSFCNGITVRNGEGKGW